MKHNMKWATLVVAGAAMMFACKSENKEGQNAETDFQTISEGLSYKVEQSNPNGQQVQEGDVLVGEMTVQFENTVLRDTKGEARRIASANPGWELKVGEALTKMHVGEIATFALDADYVAKFFDREQMPSDYQPGKNQKFYYRINLQDIVTKDSIALERKTWKENMDELKEEEGGDILNYVRENKITAMPTADGIYVIKKKNGSGTKVAMGKEVTVKYTCRLLDGTVCNSNVESSFVFGKEQRIISGWEKALKGQTAGSKLQLIIPSKEAYGPKGDARYNIPPYSPLVFDIETVSVK